MNDIQELWLLCIKALLLLPSVNKDGVINQCSLKKLSDFLSFSHLFFKFLRLNSVFLSWSARTTAGFSSSHHPFPALFLTLSCSESHQSNLYTSFQQDLISKTRRAGDWFHCEPQQEKNKINVSAWRCEDVVPSFPGKELKKHLAWSLENLFNTKCCLPICTSLYSCFRGRIRVCRFVNVWAYRCLKAASHTRATREPLCCCCSPSPANQWVVWSTPWAAGQSFWVGPWP